MRLEKLRKVKWLRLLSNKYVFLPLSFFIWLLVFDQHNLLDRWRLSRDIEQLKADKMYLEQKIETDRQRLEALRSDRSHLERLAREQYFMKRQGEEIFVVLSRPEEEEEEAP